MKITEKDITEFQALYLKNFGTEIAKDKAKVKLSFLVKQMEIIYEPNEQASLDVITRNEYGNSNEQQKLQS